MEKLRKLDSSLLQTINNQHYVSSEHQEQLITPEELTPVYFARTVKIEVLHDSPVMGVESQGRAYPTLEGPYFTKQEAQTIIKQREKEVNHVSYDFAKEIITKLYPADKIPTFEQFTKITYSMEISFEYGDILINHKRDYFRHENKVSQIQHN